MKARRMLILAVSILLIVIVISYFWNIGMLTNRTIYYGVCSTLWLLFWILYKKEKNILTDKMVEMAHYKAVPKTIICIIILVALALKGLCDDSTVIVGGITTLSMFTCWELEKKQK